MNVPRTVAARRAGLRLAGLGVLLLLLVVSVPGLVCTSCSGGGGGDDSDPVPPPGEDPRARVGDATVEIHAATAAGVEGKVRFGLPTFRERKGGGETWTQVAIAGTTPCAVRSGHPEIPGRRFLLIVPKGASVRLTLAEGVPVETREISLYPYQPLSGEFHDAFDLPEEPGFEEQHWAPAFVHDPGAYRMATPLPEPPHWAKRCGSFRDLDLAIVEIAGGTYEPRSGKLTLYSEVPFKVAFEGGTENYTHAEAGNPFESMNELGMALAENGRQALPLPFESGAYTSIGEELLILTYPSYLPAANRLAAHKRNRGMFTSVHVVNDGTGPAPDTAPQIDAWIDSHWDEVLIRPSYLLLLGDEEYIPTFELPRRYAEVTFPSDYPYSQIHTPVLADDFFPDLAIGRIPARSLDNAEVVVSKIIHYESNVPTIGLGGQHATLVSDFQCCWPAPPIGREDGRSFLYETEELYQRLALIPYFNVERIYSTHQDGVYMEDPTPRFFGNGTPITPPLRIDDGFAWDGDAQDILDAFHTKRLFIIHHDHGWWGGWGHPAFHAAHVYMLENDDMYPVVVSANCTSGAFDGPSQGFAEQLLRREGGGASAVYAFTRLSNSAVSRETIHGFANALFPVLYPEFPIGQRRDRCGDVLNIIRSRIAARGFADDATSMHILVAWAYTRMITLFGDPSMRIWLNPGEASWSPSHDGVAFSANSLEIAYPEDGAEITAVEIGGPDVGMRPIGRGMVKDGKAVLPYVVDPTNLPDVIFIARGADRLPLLLKDPP